MQRPAPLEHFDPNSDVSQQSPEGAIGEKHEGASLPIGTGNIQQGEFGSAQSSNMIQEQDPGLHEATSE
jgi:hypothetical protein